jgi:hypothetical protein
VFGRLISYLTSGFTNLIGKYAIRASVAIPFLFALAFGLAGLTVILIDAFGYRDAYFILAGGFVALGFVGIVAVWLKERHDEQEEASTAGAAAPIATAAAEAGKQLPKAIAGGASETAASFHGLAGLASRNWPLVIAASIAIILLGGAHAENKYPFRPRSRF